MELTQHVDLAKPLHSPTYGSRPNSNSIENYRSWHHSHQRRLMRDHHISRLAQTCFFHLCRLRSVRHQLGQDVTERLVCALVLSRLDYCNTVLAGLPASTLAPFATLGTLNSEVGYELVLGTRWFGYELAVGTSWY